MAVELRRADSRFVTTAPGRVTRHSFSVRGALRPRERVVRQLVCHNDDVVDPGFGYDDHPHRDMEIVTWVLSGALSHRDSSGRSGVTVPGTVQVMSAGDGIVHSETVEPGAGVTRFVQTWVRPDSPGGPPAYSSADVLGGRLGRFRLDSGRLRLGPGCCDTDRHAGRNALVGRARRRRGAHPAGGAAAPPVRRDRVGQTRHRTSRPRIRRAGAARRGGRREARRGRCPGPRRGIEPAARLDLRPCQSTGCATRPR